MQIELNANRRRKPPTIERLLPERVFIFDSSYFCVLIVNKVQCPLCHFIKIFTRICQAEKPSNSCCNCIAAKSTPKCRKSRRKKPSCSLPGTSGSSTRRLRRPHPGGFYCCRDRRPLRPDRHSGSAADLAGALPELMDILGGNWDCIFSDVTEGTQGSSERMASFLTKKSRAAG